MKFPQSFSETEILRKSHGIHDFGDMYDLMRQRSSARAVLGRGQVPKYECTVYIITENMKFM